MGDEVGAALADYRCRFANSKDYGQALAEVEHALWAQGLDESLLPLYQSLFRERELLSGVTEARHHFVIVIPVADRPRQLRRCLESLLQLCRTFGYGGQSGRGFDRVQVLIAEDSRQENNAQAHAALAADFSRQGLLTDYLGRSQQVQLLNSLPAALLEQLNPLLGSLEPGGQGASAMRNRCYLALAQRQTRLDRPLFWFIDSDQAFCLRHQGRDCYAINYLHALDRAFHERPVTVLTGKVVGDPPVSPSVMAANCLADIESFVAELENLDPTLPCRFHGSLMDGGSDAAYHDMADLFGFSSGKRAFRYACDLEGEHDHAATLGAFVGRLNGFFDGEHPTRQTHFQYQEALASLAPARTVYTGNYVMRPDALANPIPFAALRLRMAGPVLGRGLRRRLGEGFGSINLPLLHARTLEETGTAESRPGVQREDQRVDLAAEFERQFYGDLVLFTLERLIADGYPQRPLAIEAVSTALREMRETLLTRYRHTQSETLHYLEALEERWGQPISWWQGAEDLAVAREKMACFLDNIRHNFGVEASGYAAIADDFQAEEKIGQLAAAVTEYADLEQVWQDALARLKC